MIEFVEILRAILEGGVVPTFGVGGRGAQKKESGTENQQKSQKVDITPNHNEKQRNPGIFERLFGRSKESNILNNVSRTGTNSEFTNSINKSAILNLAKVHSQKDISQKI